MNSEAQHYSTPQLCKLCNAFYGSPQLDSFCSSCFKKELKPENIAKEVQIEVQQIQQQKPNTEDLQIDHSLCRTCSKKIGIRGFKCECLLSYCKKHRLPEDHDCVFDFRQQEKNKLILQNQVIKREKVEKF